MTDLKATVPLFSYGTLQLSEVQRATFGRLLDGAPDVLPGFALEPLAISDPEVVRISGAAIHTIARRSGNPADRIPGVLFRISLAELEACDRYEVDARRIEADLASGARAFLYVARES